MKKHFVTFLSPGTLFAESTTKEIESWNVDVAVEMSKGITERYGAHPYGFYFTTRERGEDDFDSKQAEQSNMYFLGGEVITLEHLRAVSYPENSILIANMEANGWEKVVISRSPYQWTQPLMEGDVVLDSERIAQG